MVSRCRLIAAATLRTQVVTAIMLAAALTVWTATPAAAEPATTVSYPTNAAATRLIGYAFDTCAAPTLATMQAWKIASRYKASAFTSVESVAAAPSQISPRAG